MSIIYRMSSWVSRKIGAHTAVVRALRPLIEPMIRWSTRDAGLAWQINDTPCRIDPRLRAQFATRYEFELARMLRKRILPGQTCLDVGANIGVWVIQLANWVGPSGRVIAFEPNPGARAVLEEHIKLNRLAEVVSVVPMAVGAGAGEVTFFAAAAEGTSRVGVRNLGERLPSHPITVPIVPLDEWCRENRITPDWLLIDIEGFEGHALAGAANLIRSRGAALGIVVELHPDLWTASNYTRGELTTQIAALGRRVLPLTGQSDPFSEYGLVLLELT